MKRMILIVILVVVLLGVGLFAYALMNANALIASFKPDLEKIASDTLGAQVQLGEIDVSVFPSTEMIARGISIQGSSDEKLALHEARLELQLLALLRKRLEIRSLTFVKPDILIVKEPEGVRIAGLPRSQSPSSTSAQAKVDATAATTENKPPQDASVGAPLDIALNEIRIDSGTVRLRNVSGPQDEIIDQINLKAGVALEGAALRVPQFNLSARARNSIPVALSGENISLVGTALTAEEIVATLAGNSVALHASLDMATKTGEVKIKDRGIELTRLAPLLELAPPALRSMNPAGGIGLDAIASLGGATYKSQGVVTLSSVGAKVSQFNISALSGAIESEATHQSVQFSSKELTLQLNGQLISAAFKGMFKNPELSLPEIKLGLFSGTADLTGQLRLADEQPLKTTYVLTNINAGQALLAIGQKPEDQKFTATVDKVEGSAALPLKGALPQAITANAKVALSQAELKGFNLVGSVLRAVKNLPFLSSALYDSVPAEERGNVDSPNTVISSLTGTINVAGGKIATQDLRAKSSLFDLEAKGTIGFDSSIDLDATMIFNPKFSGALAERNKGLKNLLTAQGNLIIPLTIRGTAPKLIVVPNLQALLSTGAGKALQEKASDILGKVLGGGGEKKSGSKGLFGF